ncbi:hypothetical protein [Streptomyces sp. B1I3]|uniref:hypothetical protein n=1 Tax=Streptomyces sp. B1I3 TaxID=3042264 RepID=UPI0027878455|nr:hypothetical protein [Streptomyces sp. B1I3]MDQ0794565.1 hypothetical protein [Streptomyces sp. B1I3]
MIAVSFFVFVLAFLALLASGVPFLTQAPLRKRGVQVMGGEVSRSIPREGRIDVQYGYRVANGGEHTLWRRGTSTEPPTLTGIVYDPEKPERADFADGMPENVARRRNYLLCLRAVELATVVLMAVGVMI